MYSRGPKSQGWQYWFLLEALRKDMSLAPLLASDGLQQSVISLALQMHHSNSFLHLHMACPLCVPMSNLPLLFL